MIYYVKCVQTHSPLISPQNSPLEAFIMTNDRAQRTRRISGSAAGICLVCIGALLMYGCYGIYTSGDQPFSREAVAAAFAPISPHIFLGLAVVAVNILISLRLPCPSAAAKPGKNLPLILNRLHAKTDLSMCSQELQAAVAAQQRSRKLHRNLRNVLTLVYCAILVSYGTNSGNFHQSQINESMIRAMALLVPCLLVPFAYAIVTEFHKTRSMEKEIELLKSAPREAQRTPAPQQESTGRNSQAKVLRWAFLVTGICILVFGFLSGGTADVLTKAINICTECVGLG